VLSCKFYQQSLAEVDPAELRLPAGSFEVGLRTHLGKLVGVDDFRELHPSAEGAPTCDPLVLTAMLLLQYRFDIADEELITRCRCDLRFRYALGLEKGRAPPSSASLKRFRAAIREKKGPEWLWQISLKLPIAAGMVSADELQGADSTNTDCRGAVIDTFNLIATAIRQVLRTVARVLDRDVRQLARDWNATRYLARSVKGQAAIDWSDESARNALLTSEIADVERLADLVTKLAIELPAEVTAAITLMRQVAIQDVEKLPDGSYRIAQGTTSGRIVSLTDPEARHGRKSASKTITGFKTHISGTLASQFVTGIIVTDAAVHDAAPTRDLLHQADTVGLKPKELVGDAAYGTGVNRRVCADAGVTLYTKLPTPSHAGYPKRDFTIDLENRAVTCPAGQTTTRHGLVKDPAGSGERVAQFRFPVATCQACPVREECSGVTAKGGARQITLNRYEAEMQEAQRFNAKPEAKAILRSRSAVERLIAHLVRMGMRQSRFFGMHNTQFQAYMTAAAYNLQRYFTLAAA
jgi:DDE family transposase/transposase-like protein DUF772